MFTPPDGQGARQLLMAFRCELQAPSTPVPLVDPDVNQTRSLQRLQGGGQGRPVHCEKIGHRPQAWRFELIERHQHRELSIGQAHLTKCGIETLRQCSGGALRGQAKASVANVQSGCERESWHPRNMLTSTYPVNNPAFMQDARGPTTVLLRHDVGGLEGGCPFAPQFLEDDVRISVEAAKARHLLRLWHPICAGLSAYLILDCRRSLCRR